MFLKALDPGYRMNTKKSRKSRIFHGASKKKIFDIELSGLMVKNAKKEKKIFLCAFNDQFKQIFFVGGS
jgi:hypothetical protein